MGSALVVFAAYAIFIVTPKIAQTPPEHGFGFGDSVAVASLYLVPYALAQLTGSLLVGSVVARLGSRRSAIVGYALQIAGFAIYIPSLGSRAGIVAAVIVIGLGNGISQASAIHLGTLAVPQARIGETTTVGTMIRNIGGASGATVVGTILAAYGVSAIHAPSAAGYTTVLVVACGAVVLAVVVGLLMPDLRTRTPERAPTSPRRRRVMTQLS
jgi:MFS family permease